MISGQCIYACSLFEANRCNAPCSGLIFLSAMSHLIATSILNGSGGSDDDVVAEILSTTIVLLGLSTASLGAVLIVAGKFRIADAVAYLPLPVVGGE